MGGSPVDQYRIADGSQPCRHSRHRRAPQSIRSAMGHMHQRIQQARDEKRTFSPAGQSTQVIVGADAATDAAMLTTSDACIAAMR